MEKERKFNDKIINVRSNKEAFDKIKEFKACDSTRWFSVPSEVAQKVSPLACILYAHFLGYANGLFRGSNKQLCDALGSFSKKDKKSLSTRTLARLIDELVETNCIKVVFVSKTTRFIYPLYTLPYILEFDESTKNKDNGGFTELGSEEYIRQQNGGFNVL